jgi:hypothetical protein
VTPPKWLREPLVHFLAAGALLYLGASYLSPVPETGRTIVIDDDALVASLQQRTGTSDADAVREALRVMPADERAGLVRDAAAQEALWREGRAPGLDTVDGVVRLRVIQQMRLLLGEEAAAGMSVSDKEVADYYAQNRGAYAQSAAASFSHLFFAGEDGRARAEAALDRLRGGNARAEELGDRFLYQSTYAETGAEELAGQFGVGFVEGLMRLDPGSAWQGPVQSDHGWHLVLLRRRELAQVPPLADIVVRVREDALAAKRQGALDEAVGKLLERYEVRTR